MPVPDLESYKVTAGELSSATKFNNLVQALEDEFADIDPDQIAGYPANAMKFLRGDGAWTLLGAYDRATSTVDVVSSVTETSIYSKVVAGNDMGTNRGLRLLLLGDYLHNNVAGDTLTLRVKFGGTTHWAEAYDLGAVVGAARHPWSVRLEIANLGAVNSQAIFGEIVTEIADATAPSIGIGGWDSGKGAAWPIAASALGAIDTSTAQTLEVTVQWSASSPNNSWRKRLGVLEIV